MISDSLKSKLLSILHDDYEECQFFMAAANLLTNKMMSVSDTLQNEDIDFTALRDAIGEIGIFLSNAEKRLEEVEECYTKLVEKLAEEKPGN